MSGPLVHSLHHFVSFICISLVLKTNTILEAVIVDLLFYGQLLFLFVFKPLLSSYYTTKVFIKSL